MSKDQHKTLPASKNCRSCGAPVYFVYMESTGKIMPVDREPVDNGNLVLRIASTRRVVGPEDNRVTVEPGCVIGSFFHPIEHLKRNRYVSHFATCKQAKDWRGKNKGDGR